jgi:hypothetical protein
MTLVSPFWRTIKTVGGQAWGPAGAGGRSLTSNYPPQYRRPGRAKKWLYEGSVKKVGLVKFFPHRPFTVLEGAFLRRE